MVARAAWGPEHEHSGMAKEVRSARTLGTYRRGVHDVAVAVAVALAVEGKEEDTVVCGDAVVDFVALTGVRPTGGW